MKYLVLIICIFIAMPNKSFSQFEFLKQKAKQKMEKEIEKKLNESEKSDEEKKTEEQKKNDKNVEKDAPKEITLATYSKFDFVPGEKIIFFDDFSQDAIGDFPALWNSKGTGEVVKTDLFEGNWLKINDKDCIWTDKLLDLPANYTIEFDVVPIKNEEGNMDGYYFELMQAANPKGWDHGSRPGKAAFQFKVEYFGRTNGFSYVNGEDGQEYSITKDDQKYYQKLNQKYHISIWVQKSRVRLYQDQNKLVDFPKAFTEKVKMDRLRVEQGSALFTNFRVAVGNPDMRNKLLTEGKLVSYGIYFDTGKDAVKPESYSTLKEIAAVLTENPNVKIKITGFTDSDGADDKNLDLSKRRAASVKNELVNSFKIEGARIETDGKGETQPIAPNDTPSNKALNRRVEFTKM